MDFSRINSATSRAIAQSKTLGEVGAIIITSTDSELYLSLLRGTHLISLLYYSLQDALMPSILFCKLPIL